MSQGLTQTQYIALSLLWLCGILVTSTMAARKNRNYYLWVFLSGILVVFSFLPAIILYFLPKLDKKPKKVGFSLMQSLFKSYPAPEKKPKKDKNKTKKK